MRKRLQGAEDRQELAASHNDTDPAILSVPLLFTARLFIGLQDDSFIKGLKYIAAGSLEAFTHLSVPVKTIIVIVLSPVQAREVFDLWGPIPNMKRERRKRKRFTVSKVMHLQLLRTFSF